MPINLEWQSINVGIEAGSLSVTGLDQLRELGERFVYVIESPKTRAISYAKGVSRICYIGRQGSRIRGCRPLAHAKGWIAKSLIIGSISEPYRIHIAHPRRQNLEGAYADIEAFLIAEFEEKFGNLPLFNRNRPAQNGNYDVVMNSSLLRRLPGSRGNIRHPATLTEEVEIDE